MRRTVALWLSIALIGLLVAVVRGQGDRGSTENVITGGDLGFRVDGMDPQSGHPVGRFVVRLKGRWVEVIEGTGVRVAK
jgi:hypothetical protein